MIRLLFVLLLPCLVQGGGTNTHMFNCLRDGDHDCQNGGTCETDGTCTCPGTHDNYDCSHEIATAGTCTPACPAGAFCDTGNVCNCPEDSYNDGTNNLCEHDTLGHVCSIDGKILVNVNLQGTYTATVNGLAACPLDSTAGGDIPATWDGVWKDVPVPSDATCGAATVTNNADGSTKTCIKVEIRYNTDYWTSLDTEVTFCCEGTKVLNVEIGNLAPPAGLPEGTTVLPPAGTSSDLDVGMTGDSGALADGAVVNIGDTVTLTVAVAAGSDFVAAKFIDCRAMEAATSATKSVSFVTAGCETESFVTSVTAGAVTTTAIKFVGFPNVFYVCDVLLCVTGSNCVTSTCARRKKREALPPSNSTKVTTITKYVRVEDPFEANEVQAAVDKAVNVVTNVNLSAAVIGLAVVVLILLVICLLLGVCLINRRRGPAKGVE